MAEKTIADHMRPDLRWTELPINIGVVEAPSYGFDPELIMLVERHAFHGHSEEDAICHLKSFGVWCSLVRIDGVSGETVKLLLFPLSLKDEARTWLFFHPANTFSTWEKLSQAFLNRYVPLHKCLQFRLSQLDLTSQPQLLPTILPETDINDKDFRQVMRDSMVQLLANDSTLMSQMEQVMTTQKHLNIKLQNLENRVENIENLLLPMFSNVCGFNPGPEHSVNRPPPDYNWQQPTDSPRSLDYNPYPEQYHYQASHHPPQ